MMLECGGSGELARQVARYVRRELVRKETVVEV